MPGPHEKPEKDMIYPSSYSGWGSSISSVVAIVPYHRIVPSLPLQLDATVHNKVSQEHGIRGFPTLKLFKGGATSEYQVSWRGGGGV